MEIYSTENGFLEELLALRSDPLEAMLPMAMNEFYTTGWNFDSSFAEATMPIPPCSSSTFEDCSLSIDQSLNSSSFAEFFTPFGDGLSPPELTDSSNNKLDTPPFLPCQEDYSLPLVEVEDQGYLVANALHQNMDMQALPCKVEPMQSGEVLPTTFNTGISPDSKSKAKKLSGQPSKNLMAERRRRKRLNDRLSMLRSVVPKISKMDRTSILGDTIDYMKELLERINNLQEEMDQEGSNQLSSMSIFKNVKPNEVLVKNSPKFDVERRSTDTRIEICCAGKPGLLLSSVTTLEALGLEIQQCVISCFSDFAMQASCSEDVDQRAAMSSEDIKQALFQTAGYGGRCL